MDKCIYAIGKDFKVAMYEYDEENNRIGAQCSEKKYPDRIELNRNSFQSYHFNVFTLACLNNIFDKEELMILYRIINSTDNTENNIDKNEDEKSSNYKKFEDSIVNSIFR